MIQLTQELKDRVLEELRDEPKDAEKVRVIPVGVHITQSLSYAREMHVSIYPEDMTGAELVAWVVGFE